MADPSPPVVVLGVGGAGKSLALRRLMGLQKSGRVEAHVDADVVPSVGVDISTIAIDKKRNVCMKEIGGAMMPLWPTYVANQSTGMMYVVDAADSFQLAASAAAFHHLCGLPALDGKPVLLVLNKIDSPRVLARGDIEATFDIDAARAVLGARLTVIEASALTGANIEAVMKWTRNAVLGDEDRGRR